MSSGKRKEPSAISGMNAASSESDKLESQRKTAAGSHSHESHRADLKRALERDFQRHDRREDIHHSFWRWMGVLGMVGWPIAIMTVGGALLGHFVDDRFNTGIQFTLLLLTIGAVVSSLVAWKALGADR